MKIMLNKICYAIIKKIIEFIKYLNLDQTVFDKSIFCIGINQLTSSRQNYKNFETLHEAELKVFSQNGEDGIIDYLVHQLDISSPNFVEIGTGKGVIKILSIRFDGVEINANDFFLTEHTGTILGN